MDSPFDTVPDEILGLIFSNLTRSSHGAAKKVCKRWLRVALQTRPKDSHINVAFLGHVDCGKSTTIGHFLHLIGLLDAKQLSKFEREAADMGKASFKYAWMTDTLRAERERGITIDYKTTKSFQLADGVTCNFIDLPGHRDFTKNMIRGLSLADVHVVVAASPLGEFEASISPDYGAIPTHLLLSYAGNIQHQMSHRRGRAPPLIVLANKMDDRSVRGEYPRFLEMEEELKRKISALHPGRVLSHGPLNMDSIPMIPCSAWQGTNLLATGDSCPWYHGPSLMDAIQAAARATEMNFVGPLLAPHRQPVEAPPLDLLRFQVMHVYKIGGVGLVITGCVRTGELHKGQMIRFAGMNIASDLIYSTFHVRPEHAYHRFSHANILTSHGLSRAHPVPTMGGVHLHGTKICGTDARTCVANAARHAGEIRGRVVDMQIDHKIVDSAYPGDMVGIRLAECSLRLAGCMPCPATGPGQYYRPCFTPWAPMEGSRLPSWRMTRFSFRHGAVGGAENDNTLRTVLASNTAHWHTPIERMGPAPPVRQPAYSSIVAEILVRPVIVHGGAVAKNKLGIGSEPIMHCAAGMSAVYFAEILRKKPCVALAPATAPAPAPAAPVVSPERSVGPAWVHQAMSSNVPHTVKNLREILGPVVDEAIGPDFLDLYAVSTREKYDPAVWVPYPEKIEPGERAVVRLHLRTPMFVDLWRYYSAPPASWVPRKSSAAHITPPSQFAVSSPFGVFTLRDGRNIIGLGKIIALD